VDTLRNLNPQLLRADGHLCWRRHIGRELAELFMNHQTHPARVNLPDLIANSGAEQLPLALVGDGAAIRPASELDPGQDLLVASDPAPRPRFRGEWIV